MDSETEIHVYFMPGMSANSLIFERIKLPEGFISNFLEWIPPKKDEKITNYSKRLSRLIVHENPILIGVSFGGLIVDTLVTFNLTDPIIWENTPGLSKGTALAFIAIVVIPIYFGGIGFLLGLVGGFLFNKLKHPFKNMDIDFDSSLDERRARTEKRREESQKQAQLKKEQLAKKRANKKQHDQNMADLVARLTRPGMSISDEGASRSKSMTQEADVSELSTLFGKAMTGVRTAGPKKHKGRGRGGRGGRGRTPVKSGGYTAGADVIRPGQLDQVVRGMGSTSQRSRDIRDQRTAAGRSRQVADRRGLTIQNPDDLSESMGNIPQKTTG